MTARYVLEGGAVKRYSNHPWEVALQEVELFYLAHPELLGDLEKFEISAHRNKFYEWTGRSEHSFGFFLQASHLKKTLFK